MLALAPHDLEHARLSPSSRHSSSANTSPSLAHSPKARHWSLALPLCILAHSALRRGDLAVARGLFRRAAAADPVLVDARRGLRMVEHKIARRVPRSGEPALVRSGRFALSFAIALVSIAAALVQTSSVLASSS